MALYPTTCLNREIYTDEDLRFAAEKLGETEENRDTSVEEIRTWIEESKDRFNASRDYTWILSFLRTCKFNIEKTKMKIENHMQLRASAPEWFENRNPLLPELKALLDIGAFIPLKKRDQHGRLVVVIRTGAHDPRKHEQNDVFKVGKMLLEVALKELEVATIYGVVAIFDMNGVTLGHATKLTRAIIKKAVFAWQNYNIQPKRLDFAYAPIYINVVLNIFRKFMNEKLQDRITIHSYNTTTLENVVSKDILPYEYGGDAGDLEDLIQYWHKKVIEYADYFKFNEQFKGNSSDITNE